MNTLIDNASIVVASAIALTFPAIAAAQEAPKAAASADQANATAAPAVDQISTQDIIVVGTAGGRGINRLKAGFAVTNLSDDDIRKAAPKSTSELLTLVPGVWVESSGGSTTSNIFVRGLPSGGDSPFVSFQLQGMPLYSISSLPFVEQSAIMSVDETVQRIEALRGGPSSVFSAGQPGLTTNFVLKDGGEETHGSVRLTATDYDLKRIDGVVSGKISDGLYFMVGGFGSTSSGIRDTQFQSDVGTQITANITKTFDGGKFSVYTRLTDNKGAVYLPFATGIPGIDKGTYIQLGNSSRYVTIPTGPGGQTGTFDMAKGRAWDGSVSGMSFEDHFANGLSVTERLSYTHGTFSSYGLFADGSAIPATALAAKLGHAIKTADGRTLGAGDYVQNFGGWPVDSKLSAVTNDLSLGYQLANHSLTVGYYLTHFTARSTWYLGNSRPMQVMTNGHYLESDITCADLASAGSLSSCFKYGLHLDGKATIGALYGADSWQLTQRLRIDLGIRWEHTHTQVLGDVGPGYPLGVNSANVDDSRDRLSFTGGADYEMTHQMGVFGRISQGYINPSFYDFVINASDSARVRQYELGYKFSSKHLDFFATGFDNRYFGAKNFNVTTQVLEQDINKSRGVELEGRARTNFGLSLAVNGTIQDPKLVSSSDPTLNGHQLQRQPKWIWRAQPAYDFLIGGLSGQLYGTVTSVGDRYSDNTDLVSLPGYTKVDAGVAMNFERYQLQISTDNLTNSHGLTEGDPRTVTAANARPIVGRSFRFSVGYKF